MTFFKQIAKTFFNRVDPADVISKELNEARLELLQAETGVEYSTALVEFNRKRVKRLEASINKTSAT